MKRGGISAAAVAALLGFMAGRGCESQPTLQGVEERNRDTVRIVRIVRTDTLTVAAPAARATRVRDTMILTVDSGSMERRTDSDSLRWFLPREEKVYADSLYRAVVSGIGVSLDSITVWPRRETITILPKRDDKRWIVGPSAGLMWDGRKVSPCIGVSVTYRFAAF
ncbi:MAG: hypothetical protein K2M85_03850 [Paramuribaculum sp.]|nr:hypothetical protein [Paramuribaculum sp.]